MMRPAVVPPTKPVGERLRVIEALASSVGKSAARDWAAKACAWRNCASARRTFWFDMSMLSISAESCGSPKISHQLPRFDSSCGSATFQPVASL